MLHSNHPQSEAQHTEPGFVPEPGADYGEREKRLLSWVHCLGQRMPLMMIIRLRMSCCLSSRVFRHVSVGGGDVSCIICGITQII